MNPPFARNRPARIVVVTVMLGLSAAFAVAKVRLPDPLLGFSHVLDVQFFAVAWVGALWSLGVFPSAAKRPGDRTLDDAAWHLDSVRSQGLPDDRALLPGGLYLSWLLDRGHLLPAALIGLEEPLADYRAGRSSIAEIFEAFGEKLTTAILHPSVTTFSTEYFDNGAYFDDLDAILGADPLRTEPTAAQISALQTAIDRRFREWQRTS